MTDLTRAEAIAAEREWIEDEVRKLERYTLSGWGDEIVDRPDGDLLDFDAVLRIVRGETT